MHTRGHVGQQRGLHGITLCFVQRTDGGHMLRQKAVLDDLKHHALVEAGGVQVGRLFGLQELGVKVSRRYDITQPQTRRQHLGKRTEVDGHLARRSRQGWRGWRVKPQVAIGVVFNDGQTQLCRFGDQGQAPRCAQAAAAGVLKVGQQVDKTRVAGHV